MVTEETITPENQRLWTALWKAGTDVSNELKTRIPQGIKKKARPAAKQFVSEVQPHNEKLAYVTFRDTRWQKKI